MIGVVEGRKKREGKSAFKIFRPTILMKKTNILPT